MRWDDNLVLIPLGALADGLAAPSRLDAALERRPAVVDVGSVYLVRVAPFYALFGIGLSLYFASQGAGKMVWPFAASIVRLGVMLVAGVYWVTSLHGSLNGLYWIVAASYLVFGSINAFAMARGLGWGERLARAAA